MKVMVTPESDSAIGTVKLHRSTRLVFSIQPRKRSMVAQVRKFVSTAKYQGPSRSGLTMAGEVLVPMVRVLCELQAQGSDPNEQESVWIFKQENVHIVIGTIVTDDPTSLPEVDIREYLDIPGYLGPTKKGIRFPWEKLPEVIALMQTQIERLVAHIEEQLTLFPGVNPQWPAEATDVIRARPDSCSHMMPC